MNDELKDWIRNNCFTVKGGLNNRISIEKWWEDRRQYLDLIYKKTDFLSLEEKSNTLPRRLWHIVNETNKIPTCKVCGSSVNFNGFKDGYREYCSVYCVTQSEERNKKIVAHPNHKIGLEKSKKTCLEKYGVEYTYQSKEFQQSLAERKLEKYGTLFVGMEKVFESNLEKYGVKYLFELPEFQEKLRDAKVEKYGTSVPPNVSESKAENDVREFLLSKGFLFEKNQTILKHLELDGYCEEKKMAFEYCGLYWHSEQYKKPGYHRYKYDLCKENGIDLITIFEDEWIHKTIQVKSFLSSKLGVFDERINARDCVFFSVENDIARSFFVENHLQGASNRSVKNYGLIYNDDLVGCVSFGAHHRNNKDIVLNRLVFKPGVQIVGGASRLVKNAIKELDVNEILTWSDNRWSNGLIYETCGFVKDGDIHMDYSYVDKSASRRISKQSMQKKKTGCPEGMTEHQWALQNGLYRIYDCGKIRWKYVKGK